MVLFTEPGDTNTSEEEKLECVVADSAAFLRNADLHNLGRKIFTVREVVGEIRDAATKQRLAVLPYELIFRTPSAESLQVVTEFSKKTGDYKSLSAVDLRVLALTYQLEKEFGDAANINTVHERKPAVIEQRNIRSDKEISGFYVESRKQKNEIGEKDVSDAASEEANDVEMETQDEAIDAQHTPEEDQGDDVAPPEVIEKEDFVGEDDEMKEEVEEEISNDENAENENDENDEVEEDDDEGGWITPSNLEKVNQTFGTSGTVKIKDSDVKCACLTTDFAMQNVLIQMGLHVLSVEGRLIRQARSYIQKCFGCYKETHDMTRVFCASCGNKTLKKVAVSVGEDGTMKYHYPQRQRNPNIRGTKFAIPAPKGGRHVDQILLVEDQPTGKNHLPKSRDKADPLDPNYCARSNPFSTNDVTSRAFNLGLHLKQKQPRNPNESRKKKSGRKKK